MNATWNHYGQLGVRSVHRKWSDVFVQRLASFRSQCVLEEGSVSDIVKPVVGALQAAVTVYWHRKGNHSVIDIRKVNFCLCFVVLLFVFLAGVWLFVVFVKERIGSIRAQSHSVQPLSFFNLEAELKLSVGWSKDSARREEQPLACLIEAEVAVIKESFGYLSLLSACDFVKIDGLVATFSSLCVSDPLAVA